MADELRVVGKRLPRWGAEEKATGSARFTVDIKLPDMLIGKILTSPHAHANIINIDKSRAEKLPGVAVIISFRDIPQKRFNTHKLDMIHANFENEIKDAYVLTEKARFVGDPILAVAAVDLATAEKALELIKVEYEPLPAVFDPLEATKPGKPVIHDFAKNNLSLHLTAHASVGNVEQGFKEADIIVEETIRTASNHICQLEPCSCVASFGPDGRLTIWSPSQHIFLFRRKLSELFDIPVGMIRWITPHIGGAFGKYGSFGIEPICVALALKTRKPVKMEFTREEDLQVTEKRQKYIITGKIGLKKDGTLTAIQEKMIVDSGAYFTHSRTTTGVHMSSVIGLYKCPNTHAEADCIYTNVPPSGGVRGYGNHEGLLVLEHLMDIAAKKLEMDPLQLRLKNIKHAGDLSNTGLLMKNCSFQDCIRIGAEKIRWQEKKAKNKENGAKRYGIGMAIMMDVSGAQPFSIQPRNIYIKFNEDGSVNLIVGGADLGQNLLGSISQIAAEALGVNYQDIHVVPPDTDISMFDLGQHASGGCYQTGNAVIMAAKEINQQLLEQAAKLWNVTPDELDIQNKQIFLKKEPQKRISISQVAKDTIYNFKGEPLNISAKGSFSPTHNPPPIAAVFTEVEVDIETGDVKVLKILYVNDSGKAINPATLEGQLEGGIAQSLGYSLFEDYIVDNKTGALETDNFNTYRIPSTVDMPEIEIIVYEDQPDPSGPYGAKGVGQGAMVAVTPSIVNAIYDATGVIIKNLPITPEKIKAAFGSR